MAVTQAFAQEFGPQYLEEAILELQGRGARSLKVDRAFRCVLPFLRRYTLCTCVHKPLLWVLFSAGLRVS